MYLRGRIVIFSFPLIVQVAFYFFFFALEQMTLLLSGTLTLSRPASFRQFQRRLQFPFGNAAYVINIFMTSRAIDGS